MIAEVNLSLHEEMELNRFLQDVKAQVGGYESAEAFVVASREDFENILKKLPDRMIVLACFGELD